MKHNIRLAALLAGASAIAFSSVHAQETAAADEDERQLDRVVVTGSFIRRAQQQDTPSPLSVVDRADIEAEGVVTSSDIVRNLTINTGSEFNTNAFSQRITAGTSQINLRGLGLNSTLTLLNGKRQVISASASNGGASFVDINSLVPLIAVERIETLKDGAAALYGSDAVAGVANFITRDEFTGLELQADYQAVTDGGSDDTSISALFGTSDDRSHLIAAVSWLDRTPLSFSERDYAVNAEVSGLGQPGALIPLANIGTPPGAPVTSPDCPTGTVIGTCPFNISRYFNLVAEENRFQGYTQFKYDLTSTTEFTADFGFARNRVTQSNSPSFPLLNFPVVPADNPGNFVGVPGVFLGRPIGEDGDPIIARTDNDTWRGSLGLDGEFNESWNWSLGFAYGENKFSFLFPDILIDRFGAALAGQGGPNNDQFFDIGASTANGPALISDILGDSVRDGVSDLFVYDALVTGELPIALGGGNIGVAVGAQYRDESLAVDQDDDSNAFNFAFVQGGNDFRGSRETSAFFAELSLPLTDALEVQLAGRYEDAGGDLDTFDPKLAVLWRPSDQLSLRGSFGTSFRAPTLFQAFGESTTLETINDPINPGPPVFIAVVTEGDETLKPEEAENFNLGATFSPSDWLTLNIDYWSFDFTDVIVQENAQALVNAAAAGDPDAGPKVVRNAGSGLIAAINPNFINASSIETNGLDFSAVAAWDDFSVKGELTQILTYDLQAVSGGATIDGAGNRNSTNFASAAPETRANLSLNWSPGIHSLTGTLRYIGAYDNDDADGFGDEIDAFASVDLQYSADLSGLTGLGEGTTFTLGANNVFDEDPPFVASAQGYDPTVHDPRGRMVYVRLTQSF